MPENPPAEGGERPAQPTTPIARRAMEIADRIAELPRQFREMYHAGEPAEVRVNRLRPLVGEIRIGLVPVISMIERRWSPDKSFLLLQRVESVVMGFEQLAPQDIPEWWNKPHPKAEGAASDNAHRAAQLLVMAKLTAGFLVDWANDIEIEERARPTTPVSTGANAATTPSRRNETAAMAQAPAAEPDNPFKGRVLPAGMRDHD